MTAILVAVGLAAACNRKFERIVPADGEPQFSTSSGEPLELPGPAVFEETRLFGEIEGKFGHHASTITAFADGELLSAWYSYEGPEELDGSAIYMARRAAGDATWSAPWPHADRAVGDGNPVLYSEGDAVWLFQAVVPFGWSTAHVEAQQSSDRGQTWTEPVAIDGPLGTNCRYPPIRLSSGRLLLPAYDDFLLRSLFFVSEDGESWRLHSTLDTGGLNRAIQPSVVELRDGRLLAVMRNQGGDWLWVSSSNDGGASWSQPTDSGFPNPGSAAALAKLSSGHLMLLYNDSRTERRRLCAALSADDGRSWPHRRVLADGEEQYSYPSIIQTPDGLIHVLYSLSRRSIQHVTVNEAWIVSVVPD